MDIEKTLELFAAITGREIAYGDGMSLFRFAKAVAAAEREACAKVCNDLCDCGPDNGCCPTYWNEALERAEEAIKARSNVQGKGQTPQAAVPLDPPVGRDGG